ncbi:RNA polymerase III subunit C82 [Serendipita sp. 405]|nr:RNA polymerase III subunit C82 [Serendipita sp. 405]
MADQVTTRLCVWIVKSHFGDIIASVVNVLASRGRLTFRQLVVFTKIRPRAIRATLLVLTQHSLLWHSSSTSASNNVLLGGKETDEGEEVFEFNVDECLLRLRFGKYLLIAKELFGDDGLLLVQTILDHGRLRFSDLESKIPELDRSTRQKLVRKMLQRRFLKSTSEYMNKSRTDRLAEMEHKVLTMESKNNSAASSSALASAKRLGEIRILAEEKMKKLEEEAASLALTSNSVKGKGRERVPTIDEAVWLRVNFTAFNIQIRNSLIEEAARARYNEGAAAVMRAILIGTEESQLSLSDLRTGESLLPLQTSPRLERQN